MKEHYDFRNAKRGAVLSLEGKERITIRLDRDVLEYFRDRADLEGRGGYQTLINDVLRTHISGDTERVPELRHTARDELKNFCVQLVRQRPQLVAKTLNKEASLVEALESGYALYRAAINVIESRLDSDLPNKDNPFRAMFSDEFVSPDPALVGLFLREVLFRAAFMPDANGGANSFRQFLLSVSVGSLLDEKAFAIPALNQIYREKATVSEVKNLSLVGLMSLLRGASRNQSSGLA